MDQLKERYKTFSVTQMVSSIISMIASLTLLFMIFRSNDKLRTTLHRLLLGLCVSDLVSSFAMSFASTLSPPDEILWNASGNMTLCRAQGVLQYIGHIASPLYNCSLCIYYLIEIKFTNLLPQLEKIEICLHGASVFISFALGIHILVDGGIKPSGTNCHAGARYPFECRYNPEVECQSAIEENPIATAIYIFILFIFVPITILCSMIMIYRAVASEEVRMNQYRFSFTRRGSTTAHRNTIAARNRAAAYSVGWLLSWAMYFANLLNLFIRAEQTLPFPMAFIHYMLFPLQGLFNFVAYVFSKVMIRMHHHGRQGLMNNPLKFLLSVRDVVMSKGTRPSSSTRNRSRGRIVPRSGSTRNNQQNIQTRPSTTPTSESNALSSVQQEVPPILSEETTKNHTTSSTTNDTGLPPLGDARVWAPA